MSTLIAKVDHLSPSGLPMLRLPNGKLFAGDDSVRDLQVTAGDILILGNQWEITNQDSWEPQIYVGTIEYHDGEKAFIRTPYNLVSRLIPDDIEIEIGSYATFDERSHLIEIVTKSDSPSTIDGDNFDPAMVRTTPDSQLEWSNFAGFLDIRDQAMDLSAVHFNLESRDKLLKLGVEPVRGILFEGPPGTGKTLLAEIMAAQSGATFYLVTTASLGGRLVSESEQRLEKIYSDAAQQEISIILIDEIEVLTKSRESEHDHGSRLVNVFLTNMDGVAAPKNVVTVGTTNRISDIDSALRRPGRFDREITFRHPDAEDRLAILQSRRRTVEGKLSYDYVASASEGWTAAEVNAIWQHAGELAVIAKRDAIHDDHFLMGFERVRQARATRLIGEA